MIAWGSGGNNPNSVSQPFKYVTAMEKNDDTANFALKAADATSPTLNTCSVGLVAEQQEAHEERRGHRARQRRGLLSDQRNLSFGTFYEGAIVAGYPTDATDNAIHANIVAAGYGK